MADRPTRTSRKNVRPMGEARVRVPLTFALDKVQMDAVSMGFIPRDMDDKWFVFYEDGRLHFHRSWTGVCVFEVCFGYDGRRHVAREVWADRRYRYRAPGIPETRARDDAAAIVRLVRMLFGVEVRGDEQAG